MSITTAAVLIGNSDDKLSQLEWSGFIRKTDDFLMDRVSSHMQFRGYSSPLVVWQNACWVFTFDPEHTENELREGLTKLANEFRQDTIALVLGETHMVSSKETR